MREKRAAERAKKNAKNKARVDADYRIREDSIKSTKVCLILSRYFIKYVILVFINFLRFHHILSIYIIFYKGHFEKGKIGDNFHALKDGFQIRILVRSMRFFPKAAELKKNANELIFIPEPENEHDINAISVNFLSDSSQVGYVCKEQNIHLLKILSSYNGILSIISHNSDNNYEFEMWLDVIISFMPEDREGIYQYLRSIHSNAKEKISFECINKKKV
jgi:hypothetical protein